MTVRRDLVCDVCGVTRPLVEHATAQGIGWAEIKVTVTAAGTVPASLGLDAHACQQCGPQIVAAFRRGAWVRRLVFGEEPSDD
jgi:hypothetical protein